MGISVPVSDGPASELTVNASVGIPGLPPSCVVTAARIDASGPTKPPLFGARTEIPASRSAQAPKSGEQYSHAYGQSPSTLHG
jgi:hypothetical protein